MQISRQIGWSQESNLLYQILKQLNKLTSIMFGLKPKYKVFTALVSQIGSSSPDVLDNINLTIGVSYQIKDTGSGFDFTNVGAPNNDYGTWFIATGTTPTSWGNGGQLNYNTGAPTVIILEDTIGGLGFEYKNSGTYQLHSNDKFTVDKTAVFVTTNVKTMSLNITQYQVILEIFENEQPESLQLYTGDVNGNLLDDMLQGGHPATVEIRVYN